jgi:hypothetical protein
MNEPPLHLGEHVWTLVGRGALNPGEEGEVVRVYADGSAEVEVVEPTPGILPWMTTGSLSGRHPFNRVRAERLARTEFRRYGEH